MGFGERKEETAVSLYKLHFTNHTITPRTVTSVAAHQHQHGILPQIWRANVSITSSRCPCLRPWPFCSPARCSWAAAPIVLSTSAVSCVAGAFVGDHHWVLDTGRGSTAGCRSQNAGRGPRSTAAQTAQATGRAQAASEAAPLG